MDNQFRHKSRRNKSTCRFATFISFIDCRHFCDEVKRIFWSVILMIMIMLFPDYFRINFMLKLMSTCSFQFWDVSTSDGLIYYFIFEILVNLQVLIFIKKIIFEWIYILVNCKIIYICSISNQILDSNKCSFSCK